MSWYPRARSEGIVIEELGDELVAYDVATQTAHALSEDAASVWRQCDGRSSAADIARRVGLEEARVAQALEELSDVELIEEPEGISRREVYKRAAKLGAGAISVPLVYSVAIGPATAAASGCTGAGCPGSGSVKLSNGTCAKPCTTGADCSEDCFIFSSLPIHGFCSTGEPTRTTCNTDADCPAGFFCNMFCIQAIC